MLAWTEDKDDPQYEMSEKCLEYLNSATDAKGRQIQVHKLPLPEPIYMEEEECEGLIHLNGEPTRVEGERLAASYVNFYIANESIIMPGFGDKADILAKNMLEKLFTGRKVVQIPARDILIGGGNIHCITQQIPIWS